jgi:NAD(P)-dependent dehydrogenase (short-subunit alcohol dehydrogenase family)
VLRSAAAIDVLANCAWGGYEHMAERGQFTWRHPFWKQPSHRWTGMMDAGVRAAWAGSSRAAPAMIAVVLDIDGKSPAPLAPP